MSASVKCLQVCVAILCILQLLLGIIFLILGGVGYNKSTPGAETKAPSIFLLVVGSIIVLVALFGLFGAIIKNSCLLISFCIAVAITLVLSIICLIVGFAVPGPASNLAGQTFNDSMPKYKDDKAAREFIDGLQSGFACCGYNGYKDWNNMPKFIAGELPWSCCTNFTASVDGCNYILQNTSYYYQLACITPIQTKLKDILFGFGIIASITAGALLITLILASCLADKMRKEYNPV